MPTATIAIPDGRTISLAIPDGATPEQIRAAGERAKQAAMGGQTPPPAPTGAVEESTPTTTPTTTVEETLQNQPLRSQIRGMLPERGILGAAADIVTDPTELGGMAGTAAGVTAGLAAAPATGGASALLIPALFAGGGGLIGREVGAKVEGRERSFTERAIGFMVDALPVMLGSALRKVILTPQELTAAADALTAGKGGEGALETLVTGPGARIRRGAKIQGEARAAAIPEPEPPVPTPLPAKPGRAPKAPGEAPVPEVGGVPVGSFSPVPAPVQPGVGPQFTAVATQALKSAEREGAVHYAASREAAARLGLRAPVPQNVIDEATSAIAALDRSGLEPTARDGARRLLESIRDVNVGRMGRQGPGGVVEGVTRTPPVDVTYGDLDAWRQKLQEYASDFAQLGQQRTMQQGSIDRVLQSVKDEMARMARGTSVESLHQRADDFFISEVQPARKLARSVLRGEVEPEAMVDAFTKPNNQQKFVRYMRTLDSEAPGTAMAFRRVKFNNMIDRATSADGIFDQGKFLRELDAMPARTREVLLEGTSTNEIRQLTRNIESARSYARAAQGEEQAILDAAYADAKAGHAQATLDYQRAVQAREAQKTEFATAKRATRRAREQAMEVPPELVSAQRKLTSQTALLQAPPAVLTGALAVKSLMAGNAYPMMAWMGSAGPGSLVLARLMATPKAVPWVNRLFRLVASGASKNAIARTGNQLVFHMTEGAAKLSMRDEQPEMADEDWTLP